MNRRGCLRRADDHPRNSPELPVLAPVMSDPVSVERQAGAVGEGAQAVATLRTVLANAE
jgi:hypothetical protein